MSCSVGGTQRSWFRRYQSWIYEYLFDLHQSLNTCIYIYTYIYMCIVCIIVLSYIELYVKLWSFISISCLRHHSAQMRPCAGCNELIGTMFAMNLRVHVAIRFYAKKLNNQHFSMRKSTIKWPCSIAMLNYHRVTTKYGCFFILKDGTRIYSLSIWWWINPESWYLTQRENGWLGQSISR